MSICCCCLIAESLRCGDPVNQLPEVTVKSAVAIWVREPAPHSRQPIWAGVHVSPSPCQAPTESSGVGALCFPPVSCSSPACPGVGRVCTSELLAVAGRPAQTFSGTICFS